jgi:hypothetical protein
MYQMDSILSNLKITVNEKIYLKDPESTTLGKKIIEESINLIHEIGLKTLLSRSWAYKFPLMKALFIGILNPNTN